MGSLVAVNLNVKSTPLSFVDPREILGSRNALSNSTLPDDAWDPPPLGSRRLRSTRTYRGSAENIRCKFIVNLSYIDSLGDL